MGLSLDLLLRRFGRTKGVEINTLGHGARSNVFDYDHSRVTAHARLRIEPRGPRRMLGMYRPCRSLRSWTHPQGQRVISRMTNKERARDEATYIAAVSTGSISHTMTTLLSRPLNRNTFVRVTSLRPVG